MKKIELTQGKYALVDDGDFEWLNQWKWIYNKMGYVVRWEYEKNSKRRMLYMHREILKTPRGLLTDHINFNGLDNRRNNLRIATVGENITHSPPRHSNISGFKGVSFHSKTQTWFARIMVNRKTYSTKYFNSSIKAAKAYNKLVQGLRGEFAFLNPI